MKKFALLALGLVWCTFQITAQTRPIMGYDLVTWGSSVADVRKAYSIGDDIASIPDTAEPIIVTITQNNVSDSIKQRIFMFNNNKLYRVAVDYKSTSDGTKQNLLGVLENKFSRRTNFNIDTGTEYLMFQAVQYTQETHEFGRYSPDLLVELIHTVYSVGFEKDTNNLLGQNGLVVRYTWKKFRDEYQASKLGL
ncbi:hypothetical protein FACS189468_9050 [Spirochaetia bacterium]|nr:hypothetical protein FACS189468_9050 [Spirochaetia bacterium]